MPTTVRRSSLTLPSTAVGPENPLPALVPLDESHHLDEEQRAALPPDMARQVGYEPLRSVLPTRVLDGYDRHRAPAGLDTLVLENDRLRAEVLPGLGGRILSLHHKPTDRELLYRNPVLQPADFALNGAWYSGGIEWNIGATGHTTLSCAPVHAAVVTAPDGGPMLRLWEWERLRDTPFQVDLWLPEGSDFLLVGVRVRNPHERVVPVYWWSNIAVPERADTRVVAPAEETWLFSYDRRLRLVPVPEWEGADRSYPPRSEFPADYFHEVPVDARKWITSLDRDGAGLVQTSTDLLRGRKLFVWGSGPGGRRWQQWLTEEGTPGYAEIQAGLARTQLEHVPLGAGEEFAWLEAYGPLTTDARVTHGTDWGAAREEVEARLETALPRARVEELYARWREVADSEPGERLATGSGWGALEVARGGYRLPGTPFPEDTLQEAQRPWLTLLHEGRLPAGSPGAPPGPSLVSAEWRELLESASPAPCPALWEYHLGVAQWHAGDRAQAVRSWERALGDQGGWPVLRCLGVAELQAGHHERSAEHYRAAVADAWKRSASHADQAEWEPVWTALGREALEALLRVGAAEEAGELWEKLPAAVRERGRFRLLRARVLLARGDAEGARALFDEGFEVADLREGDEVISDTWQAVAERLVAGDGPVTDEVRARALTEHPLPDRYDFRMRPA
ncbi:DUF5107 domain-containing protein [Streptomyces sp. NPDC005438]|uniref:DUF5107 domain-containing protein n=1 Tax=Streptomyces sp. NPDC005438 TaxID=3156880 RepID=UPI0033A9D607